MADLERTPFNGLHREGERFDPGSLMIFTGTANPALAEQITLGLSDMVDVDIPLYNGYASGRHPDGEIDNKALPHVEGKRVVIFQPTPPPAENLMELWTLISAARDANAAEVVAFVPYLAYGRQTRREDNAREPITAGLIVRFIQEAGANRIVTADLHSDETEGFGRIRWNHLYGSRVLIPALFEAGFDPEEFVIGSPDVGGLKRARKIRDKTGGEFAWVYKEPNKQGVKKPLVMLGDVDKKKVVFVDDMVDTAGTICQAAELAIKNGAEEVWGAATHALLSGDALEKLDRSPLKKLFVTDTIAPRPEVLNHPKIEIVSIGQYFTEVMYNLHAGLSIRELNEPPVR